MLARAALGGEAIEVAELSVTSARRRRLGTRSRPWCSRRMATSHASLDMLP